MFKWSRNTLQHSEQRRLETWHNIACNIMRSVFQWRLLHAAALSTSRTGKRTQHCLQYCVQQVSMEVATRWIITSNEDWKHGFKIACNIVRSVFQWRSQHAATLRATRTGNLVSTYCATLNTACFSGRGYTLQHYAQRGLKTGCNIAHNIARSMFQ